MAVVLYLVMCACAGALGFNVDIPSRVIFEGNNGSMFGYSVQAHTEGDKKMILVGAPEDEPSKLEGVTRPGAVYKCDPGVKGENQTPLEGCSEIMVSEKIRKNNVDRQNNQIDEKSGQWFGATIASTGSNGPIVACAPRYVTFYSAKDNLRDPVGSCFVTRTSDDNEVSRFSPCRRLDGSCLAGFSAGITKDGQRLYMGGPGSWPQELQGQLFFQDLNNLTSLKRTAKAGAKYDDNYVGYSMALGNFAGEGKEAVAVGVPRAAGLKGLVALYTYELQNIKNISGSQIGSYFGYSVAAGDIDGDGYDDVTVGAPMYARPRTNGAEHGMISVIYRGNDGLFSRRHDRAGEVSRGRFGLAVAYLGDINYDKFGDVAVGAPYGGKNGRGVVFIYYGSALGIRESYSQAIAAEDISSTLFTFGFSLSGGVDLDNNKYADLAVGAYESSSVVFLKSRPVVKVDAYVTFKNDTKLISLDDKRCQLSNGTKVVCTEVIFCLIFTGVNVDEYSSFDIILDLDSRQKSAKRMFLWQSRDTTYKMHSVLSRDSQYCTGIQVYLDEDIRDKLTPIEVKMTYELIPKRSENILTPILDPITSTMHTNSINIQKNCGPDNICVPDLKMDASNHISKYALGSGDNITIDVKVDNIGEDAYEAAYFLQIPTGVTYTKIEKLDDNSEQPSIYCSFNPKPDLNGTSTLRCDLGNPLSNGQKLNFRVILEVDEFDTHDLNFFMNVNSTNSEKNTEYDNVVNMTIEVVIRAELEAFGTSDPPELHYNASLYHAKEIKDDTKLGPQVIYKYNIKNEGPYSVEQAQIFIVWPYQTHTGDNLMYILVQPQWLGNVQCSDSKFVNPQKLFVQNPYQFLLSKEKQSMESSDLYTETEINGDSYGRQYWKEEISTTDGIYENQPIVSGSRRRRQVDQSDPQLKEILDRCQEKFRCKVIRCTTGTLLKGHEVWLALRARLNATVLNEISNGSPVQLSTQVATKISRMSNIVSLDNEPWKTTEAVTIVTPQLVAKHFTPLWVIILASLIGLIVLFLVIFGLYKKGFFERNRPPTATGLLATDPAVSTDTRDVTLPSAPA